MGIAFDALDTTQRAALDNWLMELTGARKVASREAVQTAREGSTPMAGNSAALVRLVRLMIGKGILTEAEGSSILFDPVL